MNKELKNLVEVIKEEDKVFNRTDKECVRIARNMISEIKEIQYMASELAKNYRCKNKFKELIKVSDRLCNFSLRYKYYVNFENSRKRWKVQDKIQKMLLQKKYNGYKKVLEELAKVMSEQVGEGV